MQAGEEQNRRQKKEKGASRSEVVYGVQTMGELVSNSVAARRLWMSLPGVFAALVLVLACVGIYGVTSYPIRQYTHEIGVRMALGRRRSEVLRLVIAQGPWMALGVAIGTGAALGLTRLMASELFGVSANDPLTFAAVAPAVDYCVPHGVLHSGATGHARRSHDCAAILRRDNAAIGNRPAA